MTLEQKKAIAELDRILRSLYRIRAKCPDANTALIAFMGIVITIAENRKRAICKEPLVHVDYPISWMERTIKENREFLWKVRTMVQPFFYILYPLLIVNEPKTPKVKVFEAERAIRRWEEQQRERIALRLEYANSEHK